MTCPNCSCDTCRTAELNAVLSRRIVSRETDDADMRRAFELLPGGRRFREPRELGKPMVDPDAEQLAAEVSSIVAEMEANAA